jgi:hypothetical protein
MKTKDTHTMTLTTGESGESPSLDTECRHTISPSRISVSDKDRTRIPLFPSDDTAIAKTEVVCPGLIIEQHHLKPLEFPERTADTHLIAMHFRSAKLEWFLGGHPQTIRMRRGSLDIIPRGTPLGGFSRDETEFLRLALDPRVVERVAGESGAAERVVLVRRLGIRDPQIEHICLALKRGLLGDA